MRLFFMTVGIPGAGKTYFRTNNFEKEATIISPDNKIGYTKENPWTPQVAKLAWRKADEELELGIVDPKKELILFDATFIAPKRRHKYLDIIKKTDIHPVAIYINPSLKVCAERNETREESRKVPFRVIRNMSNKLQAPTIEEGFHIIIDVERKIVYHCDCECLNKLNETINLLGFNRKKL